MCVCMLPKVGQNATHNLYNKALLWSYIFVCTDLSILGVNKNVFFYEF